MGFFGNAEKSAARRQQKIASDARVWQKQQEAYQKEHVDGLPKNWKDAYKAAGGTAGAGWNVGVGAVVGAVVGGGVDAALGDDPWSDGAIAGGLLGGLSGVGVSANAIHKLKVGRMVNRIEPPPSLASDRLNDSQLLAQRNMRDHVNVPRELDGGNRQKVKREWKKS